MTSSEGSRGRTGGLALAGLLLVLAALDLARPYVGTGARPWQWGVGLAAAAALWLRRRDGPTLALALLLLPVAVDHSRNLESDGIHYFSYLRSLLFDGDLDLKNDYELLGWHDTAHHNVLPVGPAVLWSPFVLPVHLGRQLARIFGASPPTGAEPLYQAAACLGSVVWGGLGLFLLLHTLRSRLPPWVAFWTTVACWLGSPLRFYLDVLPCLAHAVEFFAAVLVLRTVFALREERSLRRAALAGAACGLVFLARSQDGLLLLLPFVELAWGARGAWRQTVRLAAVVAAAFVLVASPQLLVWQAMFGTPLLVPHATLHGPGFLHLDDPELAGTLVSPRGGLFTSYPAMLFAVTGLLVLLVRDPRFALGVLPVVAAMWYLNASVFDWYQVRRYTGLVPLLAPALAVWMRPLVGIGWAAPAVVCFLLFRYDLSVDACRKQPGDPAPVRVALLGVADGLVAEAYRWTERVAPGTAATVLGAYTGTAADPGRGTVRLDLTADTSLRLPRPARHLSVVTSEDGRLCRWVTDRETRLFFSLAAADPLVVQVTLRALETQEPQIVEAFWNDVSVGRSALPAAWVEWVLHVPAEHVRAGTNVLVLRFDRAPIYRRARGEGPREVRPAALSSISIDRDTP